ncbi:hypothetical protein [Dyadobacter psychrotolerans]|uniref:Uncharacterized protein n=1 Tax=Dyadobacter psychrotolerans TaxID=2541721 RepID=A0A4R5DEE8_9BACT|nr:hypothetical protein [Dyadobacter psychrotolerans]TDE08693.1 hypothetical protein E0F88_32195 [Dyadobacter psychrotolerans]
MNNQDQYFKKLQRNGIYHYAHLMANLKPPVCEVVNSLNGNPIIEHREYDLSKPGDRIDLKAFSEDWDEITSVEYKKAFDVATSGDFKVNINGQFQV